MGLNDTEVLEAEEGGKNYVIAYSLREQKRENDTRTALIKTIWLIFFILVILAALFYHKLDNMNVVTKIVTCNVCGATIGG